MKFVLTVIVISIYCLAINSCKKDASASITGKWNLVNDSIASSIGIIGHYSNYTGANDDYFNFETNNTLYIKEGALLDTLHYTMLNNNQIIIDSISLSYNGVFQASDITKLDAHNASIHIYDRIQTPGGSYERFINLSR